MAKDDMKYILQLIYRNINKDKIPVSFLNLCSQYGIKIHDLDGGGEQVGIKF